MGLALGEINEPIATLDDWREAGRGFGRACAAQAVRNAGKRSPGENWRHVTEEMVPAMEAALRAGGGTDEEIGAFLKAAGAEMRRGLDALAVAVTAPNRRARRSRSGTAAPQQPHRPRGAYPHQRKTL